MANPPGLIGDQPQATTDQGFLPGLLGKVRDFFPDPAAAYGGLLSDEATRRAFAWRELGAAAGAFSQGAMPVPYKGGIPFGATLGAAGAAASTAGDSLIQARLQQAQQQQALANVGLSQQQVTLMQAALPGLKSLIATGQDRLSGGTGTGTDGKPLTGPAAIIAGKGGKAISSTTADTSLPPEARALLDTIAGPESGGAYNVRWGGPNSTDVTFDDFSKHPNIPEPGPDGPSTAAGRYQIVNSTYQPLAKKYGFTDFSPVTQDQAAWHLAADTYKDKTGGDLLTDLQAGKLDQVHSALAGGGKNAQWSTLNMGNYAANLGKYQGGGGASPQTAAVPPPPPGYKPQDASGGAYSVPPPPGPPPKPGEYTTPVRAGNVPLPPAAAPPTPQQTANGPPAGLLTPLPGGALPPGSEGATPGPQTGLLAPRPPGAGPIPPTIARNSAGQPYQPIEPGGAVAAGTPGAGPVITPQQAAAANAGGGNRLPVMPSDYIFGAGKVAPPGAGTVSPDVAGPPQAPPGQVGGLLSPNAAAIAQGIANAGGLQPSGSVAGDSAVPTGAPPVASPADAAAARAAAMGQEGGGIPGLLSPPAGAAPAGPVVTPGPVATPGPAATPLGPNVGQPPALPAAPSQMPQVGAPPQFQPTPQQQIAQGVAGLMALTGHPAPPWIDDLAKMPAQMAMEQYKAWVGAQTSMMTADHAKQVEMAAAQYIAAAQAAGGMPYKWVRAGESLPTYGPNGQITGYQQAPGEPSIIDGPPDPQTGRPTKQYWLPPTAPGGPGRLISLGASGPSPAEQSAGTAAGPYTPAAVPGAPMKAAPGAPPIYPQNPDPTKNIQTPGGTVLPAPTRQVLPQNYGDYAKQQDLWNERRSDLVTAQTLSAGAETKIRMMIDAAKVNQMGAGTEGRAHLGGWLVTLGADPDWVNKNLTNVPAVQQFLYGQARETLGTLAAVNKRFTGGEFKITSQSGAGTEYLNDANLPILADDLARVRQLQKVAQDFNHAQTIKYADGSYWNNPESFISQWYEANPLGKIKAQTMQQIGPLAGMTGVPGVPKEAVPTGKTSGGWPVFKMPDGREGTFPGEWR